MSEEHDTRGAASKGAAALDLDEPGWADKIDLDRLDISCPWDCILGQLHGDFLRGLTSLNRNRPSGWLDVVDYGFVAYARSPKTHDERLAILTDAWKSEVEKRRTP